MARHLDGHHPFGELIGLRIVEAGQGRCRSELDATARLHNPHRVVHGGVLFSLADTSMGAALYTVMEPAETCSTIEMKMNFIKAVPEGLLECDTVVVRRGRTTAVIESRITCGGELAAVALATYAIRPRST